MEDKRYANQEDSTKNRPASKWPQIIAAFAATLGSFGCGTGIAWSSPVLPHVSPDQCSDNVNDNGTQSCDLTNVSFDSANWIGPLFGLGAAFAGPPAFFLLNRFGRKWTLIILSTPMLLGYIMLTLTKKLDSIALMLVGRFFTGFSAGSYALVAPMYSAEISETSIRGALASLMQLMSTFGVAFVNGLNINGAVDWVTISGICIGIPVLLAVSMFFMPESPMHLIGKDKVDQARESLQWFRGRHVDVEPELKTIMVSKEEEKRIGSITLGELFTNRVYWQPFLIAIFGMFGQQFCGVNVVFFYLQTIFDKAGSSIEPGLAAFLVSLCQCFGTLLAVLIVDKFGRRILLILSDIFMCITLTTLGFYFYMDENKSIVCDHPLVKDLLLDLASKNSSIIETVSQSEWDRLLEAAGDFRVITNDGCIDQDGFDPDLVSSLGWLPLVSLMIYVIFFSIGFGPLAWTINAEIYAPEAKRLCASIAFTANWMFCFIVTKFEPDIERVINASGAYFLFAAICGAGVFVVYFCVPETKGKTPEEMKEYYYRKYGKK